VIIAKKCMYLFLKVTKCVGVECAVLTIQRKWRFVWYG